MHCSITRYQKKPDTKWEKIDSNSELKKAKVWPRTRTQPAQTKCHRSTTCATTTSLTLTRFCMHCDCPILKIPQAWGQTRDLLVFRLLSFNCGALDDSATAPHCSFFFLAEDPYLMRSWLLDSDSVKKFPTIKVIDLSLSCWSQFFVLRDSSGRRNSFVSNKNRSRSHFKS